MEDRDGPDGRHQPVRSGRRQRQLHGLARALGVSQPAVSKQVAALEEHLGAQLLQRTSRSLTLTEAGRDFYKSGVRLLGELEAAESQVSAAARSPPRAWCGPM